jgi:DnaJ-class molecular chaperone
MTEARDYYRVLQVDPDAEPDVIHAAYRRLAAKYHPDVNASPEAAQRMSEINAAYAVLKDPEQRAEYDRARGIAYAQATRAQQGRAVAASPETGLQGFARAILMMVISGIIINLIFSAFAPGEGKFLTVIVIGGLLLWKGGPILRYFASGGK